MSRSTRRAPGGRARRRTGVASAAGRDVEHAGAGGDQSGPLHDPGGGRPCISHNHTPSSLALPGRECQQQNSRNFMILYRLRCSKGHEFDSWFKDSKSYERQEKEVPDRLRRVRRAPRSTRASDGAAHSARAARSIEPRRRRAMPRRRRRPPPEQQQMAALARHMPKELRETLLKAARAGREELRACRRQVRRGGAQDPTTARATSAASTARPAQRGSRARWPTKASSSAACHRIPRGI